jgi:polycystin 1L2
MKSRINHCEKEYGYTDEDKLDYGQNWSPTITNSPISDSFVYKSSVSLDGLPYYGIFTSYNGGGYVFKLNGEASDVQNNLLLLQQANWIDSQTRSVFIEFILYNPNINLFSVCTILIEILPTGNLIKSARFDSIYLVGLDLKGGDAMVVAFYVLYIIAIIVVMVKEGRQIVKLKWGYFKIFWNYVDICLVAFSWASLFMFIYSLYSAYSFKSYLKDTSGKDYVKMQWINYWNELLGIFLAICICFATLRLMKLLRFNSTIAQLIAAIKKSFKELAALTLIFLLQFTGFSQALYLILNDKLNSFSTVVKTLENCFQILLGKFNVYDMLYVSPILSPIIFSGYNVFSLLILLNLMISLLGDNYITIKNNSNENEFYLFLNDYFKHVMKKYFTGFMKENKLESPKAQDGEDMLDNTLKQLPISVTGLLNRLEKVLRFFNNKFI